VNRVQTHEKEMLVGHLNTIILEVTKKKESRLKVRYLIVVALPVSLSASL
jgi:hypothetical protein